MYFGEKTGAGEFKGTVMFSAQLRFDILKESCEEIARNGFKKIILINGHGGNVAMLNNFARSVLAEKKDYMVLVYDVSRSWPKAQIMVDMCENGQRDYFPELTDEDIDALKDYAENNTTRGHGCLMETAVTLGVRPDLVDMSRVNAVDGTSTHRLSHITRAGFYTPFGWMSDYPNSYSSDRHDRNNERIGRSVVKYAVDQLAGAFKLIKEDTTIDEYHKEWLAKQ